MIDAFTVAFVVVLLAELGDKSQLLTLAFATRHHWWLVLAGVAIAALLILGVSVAAGRLFALALPTGAIEVAGGIAFLLFAIWTARGDAHGDAAVAAAGSRRMALLTIVGAFLVAELGDKTMLATLTLAAMQEPVGTWLGGSAGMVSANVVAIVVGAVLGARLPERPIRLVAAAAFVVFGVLLLAEGLGLI